MQQRLEQVAAETANWSAFPSRERGLSSTLEFLGTLKPRELYFKWFRQQLPEAFELLPLAGRLAQLGLFEPLEPLTQQRTTNEQPRFGIPSDLIHVQGYSQMLALFLLYQSQDHFDLGTWPWLAWKCRLQRSCGMQCNAEAAAELLASDQQTGPLACFFVASAIERGSHASEHVAALGLQRLSREAYLEDCRVLLDPSQLSGTCLLRCCQVLMTLTPEEIRMLESYVGSQGNLAQIAKVTARHAEEVHAGAWEAAASELWDEWLAQRLEERLHFLHGINPLLASPFPLPPIER